MQMTEREIVNSYRDAKNKRNQIHVLAQLNVVDPEEIRQILIKNNAFQKPGRKPAEAKEGGQKEEPKKAAVINEDFEKEVQDMISRSDTPRMDIPEPVVRHLTYALEALRQEIDTLNKESDQKLQEYETIKHFLGR